jgi:hypothetical protein
MTDDKRLADALRAAGFFYRRSDAGWMCGITDEEVLEETEGTMFRASVELSLAWEDLKAEIRKELGPRAAKIMFAFARFIGWFTKGE